MQVEFMFSGGSRDGQSSVGQEAQRYYLMTHQGTIGKRFWAATDYAISRVAAVGVEADLPDARAEIYEVQLRDESAAGHVSIRCIFVGYA